MANNEQLATKNFKPSNANANISSNENTPAKYPHLKRSGNNNSRTRQRTNYFQPQKVNKNNNRSKLRTPNKRTKRVYSDIDAKPLPIHTADHADHTGAQSADNTDTQSTEKTSTAGATGAVDRTSATDGTDHTSTIGTSGTSGTTGTTDSTGTTGTTDSTGTGTTSGTSSITRKSAYNRFYTLMKSASKSPQSVWQNLGILFSEYVYGLYTCSDNQEKLKRRKLGEFMLRRVISHFDSMPSSCIVDLILGDAHKFIRFFVNDNSNSWLTKMICAYDTSGLPLDEYFKRIQFLREQSENKSAQMVLPMLVLRRYVLTSKEPILHSFEDKATSANIVVHKFKQCTEKISELDSGSYLIPWLRAVTYTIERIASDTLDLKEDVYNNVFRNWENLESLDPLFEENRRDLHLLIIINGLVAWITQVKFNCAPYREKNLLYTRFLQMSKWQTSIWKLCTELESGQGGESVDERVPIIDSVIKTVLQDTFKGKEPLYEKLMKLYSCPAEF